MCYLFFRIITFLQNRFKFSSIERLRRYHKITKEIVFSSEYMKPNLRQTKVNDQVGLILMGDKYAKNIIR